MSHTNTFHENKFHEKASQHYAWLLLLADAVVILFLGLGSLTTLSAQEEFNVPGITWQELVNNQPFLARWIESAYQTFGLGLLGFALYALVVTVIPYRKGERWAWYVSWLLPLFYIGMAIVFAASDLRLDGTIDLVPIFVLGVGFPLLGILGLLLPLRKFFP